VIAHFLHNILKTGANSLRSAAAMQERLPATGVILPAGIMAVAEQE